MIESEIQAASPLLASTPPLAGTGWADDLRFFVIAYLAGFLFFMVMIV